MVTTSALIAETSLEGALDRIVLVAAEVIGARYAAVGVLGPDGRLLERFVTHGIDDATRARIGPPPRGHGILGLVIREARPIRLPDLARHPDSYGFPPHHPEMHSFLGVPIVGRRGAFGNLYLTEKLGAEVFSDEDEHIAVQLAATAAAVVENARLHEESARLLEEVQLLHRSRERFFAMVNHELRNSLAAVYGWAEMLVRKKDPSTVPRAAFEVLDSAQQAIGLINDLLDLSRLDEDRLKPVIRAVDPASVARKAMSRMTPTAEGKVALDLQVDADLPACIPMRAGWSRSWSTSWGTPFSTAPQAEPCGCRSRPVMDWSALRWTTTGPGSHPKRDRADLRHLRVQEGGRRPGRGARPAALPPAGAPAGRGASGGVPARPGPFRAGAAGRATIMKNSSSTVGGGFILHPRDCDL